MANRQLALARELLANMPAAIAYLTGPDLVVDFANDECRPLTGGRDVTGLPLREAMPELAGQGIIEILQRIRRTGEPETGHEVEISLREADGRPRQVFLETASQPVRGVDGAPAGLLLFAADVTAHVRDKRELEALAARLGGTQERYRTLFETLPQGVIYYDADGSVVEANKAAVDILGISRDQMLTWPLPASRRAVRRDGSPCPVEELPVMQALRTGEVVADVVIGVPHGETGEPRWLRVTAVPDARDEHGRPGRAYAMFQDLTEQAQMEAALAESTALLGRLREANVLGVLVSTEDGIHEANDAFLDMVGYSRADLAAERVKWWEITPPEWAAADTAGLDELRRTGACQPFEKEYVHADGYRVPVLIGGAMIGRAPLRWVTFVVDLSARQRAERERAELVAREREARATADMASERLALLLRAGDLAAATRDRYELLEKAAGLVVPSLADFGVVLLPAGEALLEVTCAAHRDPARGAVLAGLRKLRIPARGPLLVQAACANGTTQLLRDISSGFPARLKAEPEFIGVLAGMEPESAVATPLLSDRRLLGVLLLGREASRPQFSTADVAVVEELARRLAVGLANADTFAREHTIAETLQRSVLPDTLTEVAGLDLAVLYLPATDGDDVGGDWYDTFPLEGGRVGLVIGDVVGHSIGSASIMGQVRSVLRAYAIDNPHPADVLRRTNAAMTQLMPEALATAVYAVLDLINGDVSYANAGHPPPLVTTADGQASYADGPVGVMLGAAPEIAFRAGRLRLPPGGGLLFYTDGLIEHRRRDIGEGLGVLAAALRRSAPRTAGEVCRAAQTALPASGPREDDVCLLAVVRERVTGKSPGRAAAGWRGPGE